MCLKHYFIIIIATKRIAKIVFDFCGVYGIIK